MAGLNLYNNGTIKAIDFSPWGGIDGFLTASGGSQSNVTALRRLVPWLNKAINMTSNAVSQLPYCIESANDVEIDTDIAWGGVRNPQTLISLVAASLCGGSAYCLVETTSRAVVSLQYLTPQSVTPVFDSNGEVISFKRQLQGKTQMLSPEQVLYFWLPDDTIEAGPAQLTPIVNATLPASLIAAMDGSLKQYGERGFIPPTLLSAKGMTNKSDAEKTERWWNAFLRGWTQTVAKIINAETMTATTLGAGMDELRGSYIEITQQQIKNIAASFGIPNSTFISDENSYATALSDIKLWYTSSEFVRIYQTIEDTLSDQLWNRFGWEMEYEPEKLEAFQQEETDKSGALSTLSAAFATNPEASIIAADVLGYDLSEEQIAAIEELGAEEETEPIVEEVVDVEQVDEVEPVMPTEEENEVAAEIMTWRKFCEKPRKRQFETKRIPAAIALQISAGLREAKSQDQIQAVFDSVVLGKVETVQPIQDDTAIKALAASIDAMVMRNDTPAPVFNLTMPDIKFTAQMPGQEVQPIVFSPVIQPSEVMVKNEVTVQPANAPVNNITVQPADVTIPPMPTEAVITTDKLTGQKTLKVK